MLENEALKEKVNTLKTEKDQMKKEFALKNLDNSRGLDIQQILQSNDLKTFFSFGWFFQNLMSHRDSIKTLLSKSQGKGDSVLGEILAQEVDNRLHVEKPETTRMVTRSTKRKRGETLIQQQQQKK